MKSLKNINIRLYIMSLVLSGSVTLSGCAQLKEFAANTTEFFSGNKKVPISYVKAPVDKRMSNAKVKKIAILTFKGDSDSKYTAKITSKIASLKYNGSSYFTLIEPEKFTAFVSNNYWEKKLLTMTKKQRSVLNKAVDTVFLGTVSAPKTTHQNVRQERTNYKKCNKYNVKKQCIEYPTYYVSCTKKTANFEFTLKAIRTDSVEIIFSKSYTGTANTEHCPDSAVASTTTFNLEIAAQDNALQKLAVDIAPYYTSDSPRIRTSEDNKLSDNKKATKLFNKARNYIADKKYAKGCRVYRKATMLYSDSSNLNFNMGICKEREGDYKGAIVYYTKAGSLFELLEDEEDKEITSRIKIAKDMVSQKEALNKSYQ